MLTWLPARWCNLPIPDDTTWGFVNGEVFTGAVDALERTPVTYIVNTVGGDGNAITLSTGEEFSA